MVAPIDVHSGDFQVRRWSHCFGRWCGTDRHPWDSSSGARADGQADRRNAPAGSLHL